MEKDVLILSKTRMKGRYCVGGIITDNGQYVRLLTQTGENQPENTDFEIKQIYTIKFEKRQSVIPPHIEDVLVYSSTLKGVFDYKVYDYITQLGIKVWKSLDELFEGKIKWKTYGNMGGYIDRTAIPQHSVGFWLADKDLRKYISNNGQIRYKYDDNHTIPYVGLEKDVEIFPKGTLLRVSLARWWRENINGGEKCYLQLSGWYDL